MSAALCEQPGRQHGLPGGGGPVQADLNGLFATGKKKEAVEAQKKAIELCDEPADKPDLEKFLELFERGARQSNG